MLHRLDDTIAAIASPPGGAARGIVRVSGPDTVARVGQVFQADDGTDPSSVTCPVSIAGQLSLGDRLPPLPGDLFLWPDRRSYTGQPAAEIHTLGCPPLLEAVLRRLCEAGARVAQPGEFTFRAFLAGRLDLTQAEAVLGVIDAANRRQLDAALAQLAGGLAAPLGKLRDDLLELLAHLEAGFDFADEDLPFISTEELDRRLAGAASALASLSAQMASRGETADRIRLVLVGRPNAGKSSLFNRLAAGAAALVADQPGTTRDYLTADLDLDGLKCVLIDTAGLEREATESDSAIRRAAWAATSRQSREADVEIFCLDASGPWDAWERRRLAEPRGSRVVVLTKMDLIGPAEGVWNLPSPLAGGGAGVKGKERRADRRLVEAAEPHAEREEHTGGQFVSYPIVPTSSITGEGLDLLRARLREAALASLGSAGDVVAATAVRCNESLRMAGESLRRARQVISQGEELVAAEIRVALEELGKVVGAVYTDDILDRIFSRFCIGK
jgi:tRNA modification GTPase